MKLSSQKISKWPKVHFGDVVRNVDESVRDPQTCGLERYVGLEHLDPESLQIQRWGLIADGTSFTRHFRKGQVLFGKRRAYQRKVAVAEFDGLCSSDILVFEPKDDRLLPELLPFICQTDGFFEHALDTSAGSLSPRTKFKELARYEFPLLPVEEQLRIGEILWATDKIIQKYMQVIITGDAFLKTYRSIIFSSNGGRELRKLGSLFEVQLGKMLSPKARQNLSPKPYMSNINIQWDFIDLSEIKYMDFEGSELSKFRLKDGDLLVCEGGEVGRSAIWRNELEECYYQKALHRLRPLTNEISSEFLLQFLFYAAESGILSGLTGISTIAHLTAVKLRTLEIPVPPIVEQENIIEIFNTYKMANNAAYFSLQKMRQLEKELLGLYFDKVVIEGE